MAIVTFYNGAPKDAPKTTMPAHLGANAIITCKNRLLLEKRSEVRPHATQDITLPAYPAHTVGQAPALAARFANAAQCPAEAAEKLQYLKSFSLIFPIAEAESIPEAWREKTLLELPRVMFGKLEQKTAARLDALQDAGFAGAVVNNPAQLRYTDGWTLYGGLGTVILIGIPPGLHRFLSLGLISLRQLQKRFSLFPSGKLESRYGPIATELGIIAAKLLGTGQQSKVILPAYPVFKTNHEQIMSFLRMLCGNDFSASGLGRRGKDRFRLCFSRAPARFRRETVKLFPLLE